MMSFLFFCLVIALAGETSGKKCFHWPARVDLGPLIPYTVYRAPKGGTETADSGRDWVEDGTITLAALFDKSADLDGGTRFEFTQKHELFKVIFTFPDLLPSLASIRFVGHGALTVKLQEDGNNRTTEVDMKEKTTQELLIEDDVEVSELQLIGNPKHLTYLADLQLLGRESDDDDYGDDGNDEDESYSDDDEDARQGEDAGSSEEENDYDTPHFDDDEGNAGEEEGCACAGFPGDDERGTYCSEWDEDCKGEGGWCYVYHGSCANVYPSRTWPGKYWSCAPCKNSTSHVPREPTSDDHTHDGGHQGPRECKCVDMPGMIGGTCGVWDDESKCAGEGSWCYVEHGACTDGTPSEDPRLDWSCAPCKGHHEKKESNDGSKDSASASSSVCVCPPTPGATGGTEGTSTVTTPHAAPKEDPDTKAGSSSNLVSGVAEKDVVVASTGTTECGTCTVWTLLSLVGGLLIGAVVMFFSLAWCRPKRNDRFRDIMPSETPL